MNIKSILYPASFLLLLSAGTNGQKPKQVAQANNAFAFDMYEKVAETNKGNIFFSPNSISNAFAMCYGGASGSNEKEMAAAMHFAPNTPQFHKDFGAYNRLIEANADGNVKLSIANRLWGEQTYGFVEDYLTLVDDAYDAPLDRVDFKGSPDAQRSAINSWVEDNTNNKIKDLLPAGSVTTDTRLVLANAIYFKGDWLYQFDEKDTKKKKFTLKSDANVNAEYMCSRGSLSYYENDLFKRVVLPYKGNKQSMVLVLPHKTTALEEVEKSMANDGFQTLIIGGFPEVILELPKFEMTLPLPLNGIMKSLGMREAFGQGADFSKMTTQNDIYISSAIHKAFIKIDEKGTEAAAATAIVMSTESVGPSQAPRPKEFKANRPFLFYIIDNETQAVLFMGRMMDPS